VTKSSKNYLKITQFKNFLLLPKEVGLETNLSLNSFLIFADLMTKTAGLSRELTVQIGGISGYLRSHPTIIHL
jgi:hypothetical protein